MGNKPNILLIRESIEADEPFDHEAMEARGYHCESVALSDEGEEVAGDRPVDAIILEMLTTSATAAFEAFCSRAQSVCDGAGRRKIPVLALCDATFADDIALSQSVDDILRPPLTSGQIANRVMALARLNTMHGELARRLETFTRYGLDAPDISQPDAVGDASILVVGNGSRFPVIESALSKSCTIVGAFTRDTAEDYLLRRPFDCVLLDLPVEQATDIVAHLRKNPRFHSLPIVVLLPDLTGEARDDLFAKGVTDIFVEPIVSSELAGKTVTYIRENRFHDKMRAVYQQARHMATGDALTGLFSRGFALEHLDRVFKDQAASKIPLALCGLTIENLPEINASFGYAVGDRVIRQIGALIGQLVRGEDMTARWKGGDFLIILTSTSGGDAEVAINRIRGVINHTPFSVEELPTPINVRVDTHIVEAAPGEPSETVAKRAFQH